MLKLQVIINNTSVRIGGVVLCCHGNILSVNSCHDRTFTHASEVIFKLLLVAMHCTF